MILAGRESEVSPSGEEYVIAEVTFCISSTPLVSAVITSPPGLLQREKKTRLSFPLKTNVYINLDNRERARANGDQFRWKINMKII